MSQLDLDADFNARWIAWQTRGRLHERAARRRFLIAGPAVVVGIALAYLLMIR